MDNEKKIFRLTITFIESFYRFIRNHFFHKKDVIPVKNGGTGKTTEKEAANAFIDSLDAGEESVQLTDDVQIITHDTVTSKPNYYKRSLLVLWNYIKTKLATVATSGNYKDLSNAPVTPEGLAPKLGKTNFILYPEGGVLDSTGTSTGYLKIILPQKWTSTMIKFTVSIFNYVENTSVDYIISGYNYTDGSWHNNTAVCTGKYGTPLANLPVNFGYVSNNAAVAIGTSSTSWSYAKVVVHDIILGHSNFEYNKWNKGWSITINTTNITISQSNSVSNTNVAYCSQIVKDSGNAVDTTFAYSKTGLETASWLAAWNGYELRAISPSKLSVKNANTVGGKTPAELQNYNNLSNKPTIPTTLPANGGTANYSNYLNAISIPANANFNSYTTPGFYYCAANATVATLANRPTSNAFFMIVGKHAGVYQEVTEYMTSSQKKFMRNYYNGAWGGWYRIYSTADAPPDTNTTYSNMRGATTSAAGTSGLVPAPPAGAATRYLRSDGTWQVPTNTTYDVMRGATTSAVGAAGLVPAPSAGFANRYLDAFGFWSVPSSLTHHRYSVVFSSGFKEHSSTHTPIAYLIDNMVFLTGAITPTISVPAGDTEVTMATLQPSCRPSRRYVFRQSGSGINTYLLVINEDGRMTCSRYGKTEYAAIPAGAWLVISCAYCLGVH